MLGAIMHATQRSVTTGERVAGAVDRLNTAIALCREKSDNGTRELLEDILVNEEESVDWLEAQLHIIEEIGKEQYLAEQIHD